MTSPLSETQIPKSIRVLLIEDSDDDALLILRELRRGGFEVMHERVDTADALRAALEEGALDLILSDYSLGGFSGIDALKVFRESKRDIPFIMVSGTISETVAVSIMKAGAHDYIPKGNLARLNAAVARELREAEQRRRRRAAEAAKRAAEKRYHSIFENAIEGIYQSTPEGRFVIVNPALARMLGYASPEELVASITDIGCQVFADPEQRAGFARMVAERGRLSGAEYQARRKDGSLMWLSENVRAVRDESGRIVEYEGTVEDITERKRAEEKIRQQLETISALYVNAQKLTERLDLNLLADDITRTCVEAFGATLAWLGRAEPDGSVHCMCTYGKSSEQAARLSLRWDDAPGGQSAVGAAIRSSSPVVVDDLANDPRVAGARDFAVAQGFRSAAAFPLISHDQPFGGLTLLSDNISFFTRERMEFFQNYAHQCAAALENARLYEEAQARAAQLIAINALGRSLAESLDLNQIYERFYQSIVDLLPDSETVFISLFDQTRGLIRCVFVMSEGERIDAAELPPVPLEPPGVGTQSEAIHTRQPVIINDLPARLRRVQVVVDISENGAQAQSGLYVPMLSKNRVIGVVQTQSRLPNRYTEADAVLLSLAANTAAVAIENARLFGETKRRLENVQALRAIDAAITGSLDLRVTLNVFLDQVISQLGVDAAGVLLLNLHTQSLEYTAGKGFLTTDLIGASVRLGADYAGRAALERRSLSIPDLSKAEAPPALARRLARENVISYWAAPLVAKGQVKGVLEVFHRSLLEPDDEWLDFLETLAGQAAIAVDNATLFDSLQRSNIELTLAYEATIEGWSHALDLRDKETEGHTLRVTQMTEKLARAAGVTEDELVHVRRGALLHDIGKMGVPDAILLKPGKLTDEEWVTMRKHPVHAYEMLSPIGYLRRALDIPYCHHEKWDGTGYPRGLKGEQIPLAARLFAVVDVWDALRSDRPYRPAWPPEQVREHIRSLSGTHFDPMAVELFLKISAEQ